MWGRLKWTFTVFSQVSQIKSISISKFKATYNKHFNLYAPLIKDMNIKYQKSTITLGHCNTGSTAHLDSNAPYRQ